LTAAAASALNVGPVTRMLRQFLPDTGLDPHHFM
jgi:hypothetical protein